MMKSKKALFALFIAFGTFLVLSYVYINLERKYGEFNVEVSQRQMELFKTYQNGEKVLLYVDTASRLSLQQSIQELASNGGYYGDSACGNYFGYNLWQGYITTIETTGLQSRSFEKCYPSLPDVKSSLGYFINKDLDRYFDFYESNNKVAIPRNNYDFFIDSSDEKTKVSGIALQSVMQPVECLFSVFDNMADIADAFRYLMPYAIDSMTAKSICGYYYYKPSFTQEFSYDLEEYNKLVETVESGDLQRVVGSCANSADMDQCLEDNIGMLNTPELEWSVSCDSEPEKAFYNFVDAFRKCRNAGLSGCRCNSFSFEKLEIIRDRLGEDYLIRLEENSNEPGKLYARLVYGVTDEVLAEEKLDGELCYFQERYGAGLFESTVFEDVTDTEVNTIEIFALDNLIYSDNLRFRADGEEPDLSLINHAYYPLFRSDPYMCLVPDERFNRVDYSSLSVCGEGESEKTIRFCIKSKKETLFYDKMTRVTEHNPVTYKFAMTFRDLTPPPPVKNLIAEDMEKAEDSMILSWPAVKNNDGSEVDDLDHYAVYCRRNQDFEKYRGKYDLKGLKPSFLVYPADSSSNEIKADAKTCSGREIEDKMDYYFAVVSVDEAGNEAEPAVVGPVKSEDDLAPGKLVLDLNGKRDYSHAGVLFLTTPQQTARAVLNWETPTINEDENTALSDFSHYNLYVSEKEMDTLAECSSANNCLRWNANTRTFNAGEKVGQLTLESGKTYYFAVVAVDSSDNFINNIKEEFIAPSQWDGLETHFKGHVIDGRVTYDFG